MESLLEQDDTGNVFAKAWSCEQQLAVFAAIVFVVVQVNWSQTFTDGAGRFVSGQNTLSTKKSRLTFYYSKMDLRLQDFGSDGAELIFLLFGQGVFVESTNFGHFDQQEEARDEKSTKTAKIIKPIINTIGADFLVPTAYWNECSKKRLAFYIVTFERESIISPCADWFKCVKVCLIVRK